VVAAMKAFTAFTTYESISKDWQTKRIKNTVSPSRMNE
jgi:hypothetical protein